MPLDSLSPMRKTILPMAWS